MVNEPSIDRTFNGGGENDNPEVFSFIMTLIPSQIVRETSPEFGKGGKQFGLLTLWANLKPKYI